VGGGGLRRGPDRDGYVLLNGRRSFHPEPPMMGAGSGFRPRFVLHTITYLDYVDYLDYVFDKPCSAFILFSMVPSPSSQHFCTTLELSPNIVPPIHNEDIKGIPRVMKNAVTN